MPASNRGLHSLTIFAVAWFALATLVWADQVSAAPSNLFVGQQADAVLDRSGAWTIEEMTGPAGDDRFIRADGQRPANFGAGHGPLAAMWLRLVIPADLRTEGGLVVLTVRETRVRELDLYRMIDGGTEIRSWRLGTGLENARLPTRYPTISLPDRARGETVYIRLHTPSSMRATVWVQNEASYLQTYAAEMIFFGVLFGALIALFVYLASAAVASRDPATGALAVLTLCFACHITGDQAFFETYLFPGAADASRTVSITATFIIYTVSLAYALSALDTGRHFPQLLRPLNIMVWALAILTILAFVSTVTGALTMRRLSPLIGLTAIITVLSLAALTALKEPRRAIIFALCWVPALSTGIARLIPDLLPQEGFNPVLINLLYPAFTTSLLLAGIAAASDLRNRERALREAVTRNAARIRAFAESASDSFWETDPDGRITFATGPVCSLAGLVPGKHVQDVLDEEGQVRLKPGKSLTRIPLLRQAEEGLHHLRLSAVPVAEGGWRGIVSDVTDEVRESERINQQRRMAAIGQMAGGVAHEINNLLHPVINLSRRAGEGFAENDERRSWLEIVQSSGLRAAEIVAALLSSVRPVTGEGRMVPMGQAVSDIVAEIRALVPAATPLETHIATQEGPHLPVTEVFQVVANLVVNAVHAARGGTVQVSYGQRDPGARGTFELSVTDDGIGMDEATLARAMEPFFTTKPQGEGTGLGLSIVQGLASKWGGELKIVSSLGKGTCVTVSVPLTTAAERLEAT